MLTNIILRQGAFFKFFEYRAWIDSGSTGHKVLLFGGDASCLLPVGVCIDAYVMTGSSVLCVSTH